MAGGGGSGYFQSDPDQIKKKLRESEAKTSNAEHDATVGHLLRSLLTEANDRDVEAINTHLVNIKQAFDTELDGTVDLLFGGSVAKGTYVEGLSDIDSLVILDNCELAEKPPDQARDYFAQRLREKFPDSSVSSGVLAVTITFGDAEIQLLPAISCKGNVAIAAQTGREWAEIRPVEFSDALSKANQQAGQKLIPVVKLAKQIIGRLPERHRLSGYHTEALAVRIFKRYQGERNLQSMLKYFFQEASELVRRPIRDRTGQSIHVDDDLGSANSLERRIVSDALGRVARRMTNADNAASVEEWSKLFGE